MGLDAEMKVYPKGQITDDELRKLAIDLAEAFGSWVWTEPLKRRAIQFAKDRHCLTVNLISRYYGEGYERGPIESHIAIASWFEHRLPQCRVMYGSDCGDEYADFGPKERDKIWKHFCEVGHRPYCDDWMAGSIHRDCTFCLVPMRRYGFGGYPIDTYGSFTCVGCGWKQETHDCGKTWTEDKSAGR